MAGFADSEFPLAQPFDWFDQLSAWLVRKLDCAELTKTPHCASHGHDCTIGVGLVASCHVNVARTCRTNGVRCLATL